MTPPRRFWPWSAGPIPKVDRYAWTDTDRVGFLLELRDAAGPASGWPTGGGRLADWMSAVLNLPPARIVRALEIVEVLRQTPRDVVNVEEDPPPKAAATLEGEA